MNTNELPVITWKMVTSMDLATAIQNIISAMLMIVVVFAVFYLILCGFQYILSSGNPEAAQKAKSALLYVIVGLIMAFSSSAIVNFIISQLK